MNIGILFYALGWKIIKIFTNLKCSNLETTYVAW
jgi:hypothetical protein